MNTIFNILYTLNIFNALNHINTAPVEAAGRLFSSKTKVYAVIHKFDDETGAVLDEGHIVSVGDALHITKESPCWRITELTRW